MTTLSKEDIEAIAKALADELQKRQVFPKAIGRTSNGTTVMSDGTERPDNVQRW